MIWFSWFLSGLGNCICSALQMTHNMCHCSFPSYQVTHGMYHFLLKSAANSPVVQRLYSKPRYLTKSIIYKMFPHQYILLCLLGFPGGSVAKNLPASGGDTGSVPGYGRSPGGRKWQSTPVFLPGKSHGQRHLGGYSQLAYKQWDMT